MMYVDTIEALLGRPASDARAVHVSVWTVGGDRVQVDCHGTQTVGALRQRVAHELRQGPTGFPKTSQIRLVHGNSIVTLTNHALLVDIAPGQPAIDLTCVVLPPRNMQEEILEAQLDAVRRRSPSPRRDALMAMRESPL